MVTRLTTHQGQAERPLCFVRMKMQLEINIHAQKDEDGFGLVTVKKCALCAKCQFSGVPSRPLLYWTRLLEMWPTIPRSSFETLAKVMRIPSSSSSSSSSFASQWCFNHEFSQLRGQELTLFEKTYQNSLNLASFITLILIHCSTH